VVTQEHGGRVPETAEALRQLPGIGPYTAAAIAAIAFDRPETVVDGNVERVIARRFDIRTPLPAAKPEIAARAGELTPEARPGCYAQAVMDLGATICTPKNPACGICPWRDDCAGRLAGTAADLPAKTPKKPKPVRHGIAYLARRVDGAWLLERRPDSGLLGGMLGWPGSEWTEGDPAPAPPIRAEWREVGAEARHTFTHFHLRLALRTALVPMERTPERGAFLPLEEFRPSDLPTVMRKAFDLAAKG
jgi:A/G-specific adenine glycosylase